DHTTSPRDTTAATTDYSASGTINWGIFINGSQDVSRRHYVGIFCISLATLLLELAFTRVLAVASWYHFAFLIISMALLGFGTSGVVLTLPGVTLVTDEGRNFLRRSKEKYDVIISIQTMTAAAVTSGAMTLSESYMLTLEAFGDYCR